MKRLIALLMLAGTAAGQDIANDKRYIFPAPAINNGGIVLDADEAGYRYGFVAGTDTIEQQHKTQTYHVEYTNIAGETMIDVVPDSGGLKYCFMASQNYRTQPITWGELEAYLEYCHNDSTMEIRGRGQSWVLLVNPPIVKYEYYDTVYVHKQPTLPGFMLWKKNRESGRKPKQ